MLECWRLEREVKISKKRKGVQVDEDGNSQSKKMFFSGDSVFSESEEDEDDDVDLPKSTSKLDFIIGELKHQRQQLSDVQTEIKDLKKKEISKDSKESNKNIVEQSQEMKDTLMLLSSARSMEEVEGIGFTYNEDSFKVICTLCEEGDSQQSATSSTSGEFKYNPTHGLNFNQKEKISRPFINLKAHLKAHILNNKSHSSNLSKQAEMNAAECELLPKNRQAGLNLGRAAVKNYIHGRPYLDYENDVLIMKKSGGIVGEINHSRIFPAKFRSSVARVVNGRIRKFMKSPLKQTGHLPPVAVSADKGTFKGTPRQFCGVITVNPGRQLSGGPHCWTACGD